MTTKNKLTLWIEPDLASFGKEWSQEHGQSLSMLISDYLSRLRASIQPRKKSSRLTTAMSGIIPGAPPADTRGAYQEYLDKKYARA